jgi:hypothetical protein
LTALNTYKNNTFIKNEFLTQFFYDLYFNSVSILYKNKRFLPVHVSFTCNSNFQNVIKNEIDKLKILKKNFILVEEFTDNKNHFHIILLEPFEFFLEKNLYKKRKIINILQFLNVLQYITKEVFIFNDQKKNNLIFFLNKKIFYEKEELNEFITKYVDYYE